MNTGGDDRSRFSIEVSTGAPGGVRVRRRPPLLCCPDGAAAAAYAPTMAGDEDEDETHIVDTAAMHGAVDEVTDDDRTLIASFPRVDSLPARLPPIPRDDQDETRIAVPLARFGSRGSLQGPGPVPKAQPPALPEPDLDARALPFDTGLVRPIDPAPRAASAFVPVTQTQELPNVSQGLVRGPLAVRPPPSVVVAAQAPSIAPALHLPAVLPAEGTPLLVIRFLLVCGVITAVGLLTLIYLEL
jgi:hypothetical protein